MLGAAGVCRLFPGSLDAGRVSAGELPGSGTFYVVQRGADHLRVVHLVLRLPAPLKRRISQNGDEE